MRILTVLLSMSTSVLAAQAPINGPMVGHCDMLEATIWLQCKGPCTAQLEYWKEGRPDSLLRTPLQASSADRAHAMDFRMDQVVPATTYEYRVVLDDKPLDLGEPLRFRTQPLWKFRNDPPDFTMATGSCTYVNEPAYDRPGKPYGAGYGIFDAIAAKRPDLMLWLGDNIYLREPDWGSRTGFLHRYTHTRSLPEMQHLLRSTANYAIWDDHDFGPNDADGSFVNAAFAKETFDLFWPNPGCGIPEAPHGITTAFSHADVDFFLLDDRTYRIPPDVVSSTPTLLGGPQQDWLIRALKYSDASFKVVALGGQFLSTASVFENYATFPAERQRLIDRITQEGITGVVFLTGDRHFTELSHLVLPNGAWILDLTSSPLTSGPYVTKEENALRVPGTLVTERGFATLSFSGPKAQRVLTVRAHNTKGEQLWEHVFQQPTK
ncbi:MAG: alkaline phosphatase family protein [Flavobacteriales bacterium]|nr:alkaline phosphatase family protein [Flavobacteriales bacterium]